MMNAVRLPGGGAMRRLLRRLLPCLLTTATLGGAICIGASAPAAQTQAPPQGCCDQGFPAGEWQVTSAEKAVAFYHEVLGLDLPPGWTGKTNPPSPVHGPLTGAVGGYWRVVGMPIPGARWSLQIVETTGLDRRPFAPRRQDVGATGLILYVRDLDTALRALRQANAPIVTSGGAPVRIGSNGRGRAVVATDPDGFFVEVRQMEPPRPTTAPSTSNVIGAAVSVSIADTEETASYWRDVLGFDVRSAAATSDRTEQTLYGTPGARIRKSIATIRSGGKFYYPGADLVFELLEFSNVDRRAVVPRYQDPGAGGFVLRLRTRDSGIRGKEMADFVKVLKSSDRTRILTAGGDALDQGRRFAIFFQDMNGFILEATQSTPDPNAAPSR